MTKTTTNATNATNATTPTNKANKANKANNVVATATVTVNVIDAKVVETVEAGSKVLELIHKQLQKNYKKDIIIYKDYAKNILQIQKNYVKSLKYEDINRQAETFTLLNKSKKIASNSIQNCINEIIELIAQQSTINELRNSTTDRIEVTKFKGKWYFDSLESNRLYLGKIKHFTDEANKENQEELINKFIDLNPFSSKVLHPTPVTVTVTPLV